jgi:arginase family enzyme
MVNDPNWPRASEWLVKETPPPWDLALVGLPLNHSITPGHCDLAPAAVREALARYSTFDVDAQLDVASLSVKDFGDVDLKDLSPQAAFEKATAFARKASAASTCTILLGGDNGITRGGVHALGLPLDQCGLLTFDTHHDFRTLEGGLHHGNPIRALLQDGLRGANVIQIGIQPFANSKAYADLVRQNGITTITADEIFAKGIDAVVSKSLAHLAASTGAVYVDLDLDVLDRSFAPACPGSRPGGLQPRMLRNAARLCGKAPIVRMIDFVEIDPSKDINDTTSLAAASFVLAFASGVASRAQK